MAVPISSPFSMESQEPPCHLQTEPDTYVPPQRPEEEALLEPEASE